MKHSATPILNVFLNSAASDEAFANVRSLLERTMVSDPSWQGTRFRLYRELYTWVGEDSERAGRLFEQVRTILMQDPFEHPEMIV